jgi:pyruvate/2-oxoglutarate dehydrogenase complex dihydrolipoamide acyltransferase (E2) component
MFQDYQVAYLRRNVRVREAKPLSFLRESVAYVLSQAARSIPHAAAIAHYDVTPLVEYGKRWTDDKEQDQETDFAPSKLQRAIRRIYSPFFVKAVAHCLHHVPQLNGFLDYAPMRTGGTLYIAEDINLSFTVHTKYGVLKPIVRNPHKKKLETVANEMRALSRKARRTNAEELYRKAARAYLGSALREINIGALPTLWVYLRSVLRARRRKDQEAPTVAPEDTLQVSDILGATCTVANIGMMMSGHQTVTVIIPPEMMMFGIGDIHQVPWVVDGKVVPRHVVTVAGTIDHRAFDGGEVFPFYHHLKRYIDDPSLIYDWTEGDDV